MGAGHGHWLDGRGDSAVHRLPAHVELVALVAFVLVVVATPREQVWAYAGYAVLLAAVAALARVRLATVLPRLAVEAPFVVFALLLPFVALGPRIEVLGVSLSQDGLWGAFALLAKATAGVVAAILLAATTTPRDLLVGLQRLRVPPLLVQIASSMVRYADVVVEELRRMGIARVSRGFVARDLRQWPALASTGGALFVRSYERGERVHLAMLSRGYAGAFPVLADRPAAGREWLVGLSLPAAAVVIALTTAGAR